jgi:nucleotide-binding universal stress UspA family protein
LYAGDDDRDIVVGVDGSEASREALRFGAEEAALRQARLVAVHAWLFIPPQPLGDPGMLAIPAGDLAGQLSAENDAATLAFDEAIADALGADASTAVDRRLVEGDAGEAIVAQSAEADLVVVGSHGRSGIRAALLGSVSRHVVDHATCPVVVVKASR